MSAAKSLFVHIPKTGGMSIRRGIPTRIITASGGNHISMAYTNAVAATMARDGEHHGFEHARIRDWSPKLLAQHPAVAIVRNPWERVVSRYLFARIAKDRSGNQSFAEFLQERLVYGGRKYYWHRAIRGWYPQSDYVTDPDGRVLVSCLRFGTDDYMSYFELKDPLPKRNVSNTTGLDYREFYSPALIDLVGEWYESDIDLFGFQFDTGATRNIWRSQ